MIASAIVSRTSECKSNSSQNPVASSSTVRDPSQRFSSWFVTGESTRTRKRSPSRLGMIAAHEERLDAHSGNSYLLDAARSSLTLYSYSSTSKPGIFDGRRVRSSSSRTIRSSSRRRNNQSSVSTADLASLFRFKAPAIRNSNHTASMKLP